MLFILQQIELTHALILPTSLFIIGVSGVVFNKKNLIVLLLSLELVLLSATLNFIFFSIFVHDDLGQMYALLVLTVAAAESSIGLGILIVVFRVKKDVKLSSLHELRG